MALRDVHLGQVPIEGLHPLDQIGVLLDRGERVHQDGIAFTGIGQHAAVRAGVAPGKIAAVVGDGVVGLCAVIAAKRLGAEQIIILGRHEDRTALARELGATDIVAERGEEAVQRVRELAGGQGAHSVLECSGLAQSAETAIGIARPGGAVGRVGVSQDEALPASQPAFYASIAISGGPAPVRAYIEEVVADVLEGWIEPGRVLDRTVGLDGVPDGYRAMPDREAIKVTGDAMTEPSGTAQQIAQLARPTSASTALAGPERDDERTGGPARVVPLRLDLRTAARPDRGRPHPQQERTHADHPQLA